MGECVAHGQQCAICHRRNAPVHNAMQNAMHNAMQNAMQNASSPLTPSALAAIYL